MERAFQSEARLVRRAVVREKYNWVRRASVNYLEQVSRLSYLILKVTLACCLYSKTVFALTARYEVYQLNGKFFEPM